MYRDIKYLKYKENENLVNAFFDDMFFFDEKNAISVLESYCIKRGNGINSFEECCFASEFPDENLEDYFGKEGVAFYFSFPTAPEDCAIVLTYKEFFNVVQKNIWNILKNHLKIPKKYCIC